MYRNVSLHSYIANVEQTPNWNNSIVNLWKTDDDVDAVGAYFLGLLAMIKCSICSYQCDNWYVSNWRLACHINFYMGKFPLELAQGFSRVALAWHKAGGCTPFGVTWMSFAKLGENSKENGYPQKHRHAKREGCLARIMRYASVDCICTGSLLQWFPELVLDNIDPQRIHEDDSHPLWCGKCLGISHGWDE